MKFLHLLALCVHFHVVPCTLALFPISPCPDIFKYVNDLKTHTVYGAITIEGYRAAFNNTLEVILSMPSMAHTTGSLELLNINDLPQKPARLRVSLPHPLPKVVSIKLNQKDLCSGPAAQGQRITTIKLHHYTTVQAIPAVEHGYDSDAIESHEYESSNAKFEDGELESLSYESICGQPINRVVPLMFQGTTTYKGEWPWLSALYSKNKGQASLSFRCGAALISGKVLLTAAHCLVEGEKHLKADDIVITLGRYNIMDWSEVGSRSINPKELVIHSSFRSDAFDYDIAAIILPNEVIYSNAIRPVCVWTESDEESLIVDELGSVVGWGFSEAGILSDVPKSAQVPIVSGVDCLRSDVAYQQSTSERTLCAGGQGATPCSGDSGGGLFILRDGRWVLRGIVSSAPVDADTGKCSKGKYTVYTDVAKYREWMEEHNLLVS